MLHLHCRLCPYHRCSSILEQRAKYGAPRFKPKMSKIKPMRTPSMLALDHFDFYYGPLYGDNWPSIRLGLLTPNKFAAILNRFSQNFEVNRGIIQNLGTVNLIEKLTNSKSLEPSEKFLRIRHELDDEASQTLRSPEQSEPDLNESELIDLDADEPELRTELGISQFVPPTKEIVHGFDIDRDQKLNQSSVSEQFTSRRLIYDHKFKITGLEAVDMEALPSVGNLPIYPSKLTVFIHPRMSLNGFPGPIRDRNSIQSWWLLDGGSIVPVLALDLDKDDLVLDMCASPGGKSLLIVQTDQFASLVCNDNKIHRLGQLRRALASYIPNDSDVSDRIIIKRKDAASVEAWDDIDMYDKVLVDVPCTTDRLSVTEDQGNVFATDKTTERLDLPQVQTRMLINALRSVRAGGSVVYSTCSMAPTQNECVVENAAILAKSNYGIECVERSLKRMERQLTRTELYRFSSQQKLGSLVLPHLLSNFGPMFVCKLQRLK